MENIIREYKGKTGTVQVIRYEQPEEYRVKHSNASLCLNEWHRDKTEAIAHAQFLTKY